MEEARLYGTGKRKTSVARVWMKPGTGKMVVNEKSIDDYFGRGTYQMIIMQPLELTENVGKFDISVKGNGGGISGQAGAIRHGITKALMVFNAELRGSLKKAGLVSRDPREKERKKYGQPGARKRFQFSKR